VGAKLIFTNKKEGNIQAAAMVFELVSNVYERNSIEKIEKTTKLYKGAQIDVELHNPFPTDVLFTIQILQDKPGAKGTKKPNDKASSKKGSEVGSKAGGKPLPDPFSCKLETIKVRKN
jgi:hypothetical protein